jgi:uncharacterized repeat protein (TIGR03943 family)
VSRPAQGVVLLLLGAAVLKVTLTDVFLRYVKEGLRPLLLVAGGLLVAAAVMTIVHELRSPERDHHHHEPWSGWLLLLPVIGLLLVVPPPLGSYAADQAGAVAVDPAADAVYPPLPPGDPAPIGLVDYASRALFDDGKSLAGRTLQLSGFITPGPDGHPMLARIVLTCCAADGRPIKIGLTGTPAIDAAPDTWVAVVGVYSGQRSTDPVNHADVAYLQVKSWQQIAEPKRPYA